MSQQPPTHSNEAVIFQGGGVSITPTRFVTGSQTYVMRNITSVRIEKVRPPLARKILYIVLALVLIPLISKPELRFLGLLGILLIAGIIFSLVRSLGYFSILLTTSGGELTAFKSRDKSFIAAIHDALITAIAAA